MALLMRTGFSHILLYLAMITKIFIGIGLLAVLLPLGGWAQDTKVGEVKRIVEGRAKQVTSTSDAVIILPSAQEINRVTEGQELHEEYTLKLQDQLWMELKIDHGELNGHAILAEAGLYAIDALKPDKLLSFRLRQGRMSIRLRRGKLGVFLKDRLLSIFGTEVFLQADTTLDMYRIYLKKGHIMVEDSNQVFFDVTGKDMAWRWQGNEPPVAISGEVFNRWKQRMKYDSRTVWRKPFFKRGWVRLGVVSLVGAAILCAVQCGSDKGPSTARGEVIITIPD